MAAQGGGKGCAAGDFILQSQYEAFHSRVAKPPGDDAKGLHEGHAGPYHGRELAREEHEISAANASAALVRGARGNDLFRKNALTS